MIIPVSVKNQSIDSSGITSDYKAAISEYIWNGFEANAKKVSIEYTLNEAFGVKELIIKDNGDGINYDELGETFGAFLASKKNLLSLQIKSKANKGKDDSLLLLFQVMQSGILSIKITMFIKNMILICPVIKKR